MTIKQRVGEAAVYRADNTKDAQTDFPMVCLVNGVSASGSEIVAAALQDHRRAYLVGERTYGKGTVQNVDRFDGGKFVLTTSTFQRPSGKNLDRAAGAGRDDETWGVIPDRVVALTPNERGDLHEAQRKTEIIRRGKPAGEVEKELNDRQLEAALEYLRAQMKLVGEKK
jgi:C-terminal processing protease CtpA/Prc